MTTETSTLVDFLLARIAEDERFVQREDADPHPTDRARVLAECAAKRRIMEWAADVDADYAGAAGPTETLLPLLALPYADHPDYRPEWRS